MKQQIFDLLKHSSATLVFKTEIMAKSWTEAFAKEYGACFEDRCISWDTFVQRTVESQNQKATEIARRLFASYWTKDNLSKLRYFVNPLYKEDTRATTENAIATNLVNLNSEGKQSSELKSDLALLKKDYNKFLNDNGLIEVSLCDKDLGLLKERYVIVCPEIITDTFVNQVKDLECIESPKEDSERKIEVYQNSITEIRCTLRKIFKLLKEGKKGIVITCANLDSYRPYLEEEAFKRGIKLHFNSGKKLSEYAQGKLFESIKKTVDDSFSMKSVRQLFLSPSFGWKEEIRNNLIDMVLAGTDAKIKDGDRSQWLKVLKEENNDLFYNITDWMLRITRANEPIAMLDTINSFLDMYFEDWFTHESREMGSILDILTSLGKFHTKTDELYPLFISIIKNKLYVERQTEEAIEVYQYPSSCGICTPYHFVIGLDDKSTKVVRTFNPLSEDSDEINISNNILNLYSQKQLCTQVVLSSSLLGFDGAKLVPTFFDKSKQSFVSGKKEMEEDPFSQEEGYCTFNENTPCTTLQTKWHEKYKNLQRENNGSLKKPEPAVLSPSKLDDFRKCTYRGFCENFMKFREPDWDTLTEDPRVLGNVLHLTVQDALKEVKTVRDLTSEILNNYLERACRKLVKDEIEKKRIYSKFKDGIGEFLNKESTCDYINLDLVPGGTEMIVKDYQLDEGISMKGRIDLLLQDTDGKLTIVDFKTNTEGLYSSKDIEKVSIQLAVYAKILNKDTKRGAYFSFKKSEFKEVWPRYSKEVVELVTDKRLEELKTIINSGNFKPNPSDENCKYCDFRRLCRRRYGVR